MDCMAMLVSYVSRYESTGIHTKAWFQFLSLALGWQSTDYIPCCELISWFLASLWWLAKCSQFFENCCFTQACRFASFLALQKKHGRGTRRSFLGNVTEYHLCRTLLLSWLNSKEDNQLVVDARRSYSFLRMVEGLRRKTAVSVTRTSPKPLHPPGSRN